ncbi:MAG TPA: glycosyltransferase family A protein [Pyrinomonadaceae bacterium]|nr:glycosyltransferase family A protein [Pyrinomonadaceae bacterium]
MNSKDTNLVSVVISCYNHEEYLGEAIESVLAQTYPHFEVIVVDDGSTDRSWDVAQEFSGIRSIQQENRGTPAATRNRGLQESRGEYVVFLDGDDRLLPHALEIGVRHLERYPDCAYAAGRCQSMSSERRCLSTFPSSAETDHYRALLIRNYILTPGSVIFRRSAVNELKGFNSSEEIKGSDDYDMYLRIAARWPVFYHDDTILEYREHDSNLSKNPDRMLKSTVTVLRAQQKFAKQNPAYREAYNQGMSNWREFYGDQVVETVRDHVRDRNWRQALKGIQVLSQYSPWLLIRHAFRKLYCVLLRVRSDRVQVR